MTGLLLHLTLTIHYFVFISITTLHPSMARVENEKYIACSSNYSCGHIQNIGYPFWGDGRPKFCGREEYQLYCPPNSTDYPVLLVSPMIYRVVNITSSNHSITLAQLEFLKKNSTCPTTFVNTTISDTVFEYIPSSIQFLRIFYGCPDSALRRQRTSFSCQYNGTMNHGAFYLLDDSSSESEAALENGKLLCDKSVIVPVPRSSLDELREERLTLLDVLNRGFTVKYKVDISTCSKCEDSGGICGSSDDIPYQFQCYYERGRSELTTVIKAVIGVGASFGLVGLLSIIFFVFLRQRKKEDPCDETSMSQRSKRTPGDPEISLGIHLFTYNELEEATSYFADSNELGEGGFGTVYYGKLKDGREVAIKRLFENSSKWLKTYMNEVEILTRLRQKNLVTLYGCTSRRSRELLLVYEFVANGTVADHIHGKNKGFLAWPVRLNIAIETANALVYLHASDIIHRDVKTHNILLDENFQVKVADFGMSRLIPLDVTHVSTAPQGTPGYVDPEYHQCYHLTDKSDVFSFGVVLIELISSLAPVDITRRRNEINLSNLAMNKIQSHELHEIVDASLGFELDYKVNKEVRAVAELAFQCLQSAREMRPTMEEVLDTLVSIQSDYGKKGETADIFDIPAEDAVSMKGDLSSPFSPLTQKSGTTDLSSSG